jgi:hypothetical protein
VTTGTTLSGGGWFLLSGFIAEGAMTSPSDFQTLQKRFRNLRSEFRGELYALYTARRQDQYAAEVGSAVAAMMGSAVASEDLTYRLAREAWRAAGRGSEVDEFYNVSSALRDDTQRRILCDQWNALAVIGGRLMGETADPRKRWLDTLRLRSARYSRFESDHEVTGGHIGNLCIASAELCVVLESEAPVSPPAPAPLNVDWQATKDSSTTLPLGAAAEVLKSSTDTLIRLHKAGKISLFRLGHRWKMKASELHRIRSDRSLTNESGQLQRRTNAAAERRK